MEKRPNPDLLLARVQADQGRQACGRLKIFFGASAGVGKTYAMLEAAHEQRNAGVDVLAGYSDQIWVMLVVALVISTLTTRIKR